MSRLFVISLLLCLIPWSHAQEPLRALLLTTQGIYHDYEYQSRTLSAGVAARANVQFDVSLAEEARWRETDFSRGYDVLLYNICMADTTDTALIDNLRRQTELLGVPAVMLHCTMHSFRKTDRWWPLYGLKTLSHEALGSMTSERVQPHPVLANIPADWALGSDELYINEAFTASALLVSRGETGEDHVTTWVHRTDNGTKIFGTTLGHSDETIADPTFQTLITNALLWVTGQLEADGEAAARVASPLQDSPIRRTDRPAGTDYFNDTARECMQWEIIKTVGPCVAGCTLHPLKWGEAASACRDVCYRDIPGANVLGEACADS